MTNSFIPATQSGEQGKPLPTVELSLKYMAWDIKKMVPAIQELTNELRALRMSLSGQLPTSNAQVSSSQETPF